MLSSGKTQIKIGEMVLGWISVVDEAEEMSIITDSPTTKRGDIKKAASGEIAKASSELYRRLESAEPIPFASDYAAAVTLAAMVLIEMRRSGALQDQDGVHDKRKKVPSITLTSAQLNSWVKRMWVSHAAAVIIPKCVRYTRGELRYAVINPPQPPPQ